ncbi:hypothetical protein [Deferrisoma camini]|uniref:hypothetical protein n=1 Tax=Deferrisoma camini TaxID=1035120 RepID=UPI0004B8D2B4|nr:hypothetical protein [Deferrisoma camini]
MRTAVTGRVALTLFSLVVAARAWAGPSPDFACVPEIQEVEARLARVEERLRAYDDTLWEIRGSYFYYPDPNLTEEDLTGTQQRADLYLRYPLWERFRRLPLERQRLEAEIEALRAERDERVRTQAARARAAQARHARARELARRARERAGRLDEEARRLEGLWLDKVVLLEDVLAARRDRDEALAEAARWDAEARTAWEEWRGAQCAPPDPERDLDPVVFPDPSCDSSPGPPASLLRRARLERELGEELGRSGARLDFETGYTWEEDVDEGLQGGGRIGIRFVWPLGGSERRGARAAARRWEARARAQAVRAGEQRVALWARVDALVAEDRLARTEAALAAERERTRSLRGDPPRPAPDPLERAWDVYLEALELHARLFPAGVPACERPPKAVFRPPQRLTGLRKNPPRGVYVWGGPSALGDPSEAVAFCRTKGIDRIYLSPGGTELDPFSGGWERVLRELVRAGIEVHLLLGENRWAEPGGVDRFRKRLTEFETFQTAAPIPFQGLHLDVEPQALAAWPREKENLIQGLVEVVETARRTLDSLPTSVPLTASFPLWLAQGASPELVRRLAAALDGAVLMAYGRPRADRVSAAAGSWRPTPCWPAVNAREAATEGELEREIRRLAELWPNAPRVEVHDWAHWRRAARAVPGE